MPPAKKLEDTTEYIVFYESVNTTTTRLREDGSTETIPIQDKIEHRVPLAEWAQYEKDHGWA